MNLLWGMEITCPFVDVWLYCPGIVPLGRSKEPSAFVDVRWAVPLKFASWLCPLRRHILTLHALVCRSYILPCATEAPSINFRLRLFVFISLYFCAAFSVVTNWSQKEHLRASVFWNVDVLTAFLVPGDCALAFVFLLPLLRLLPTFDLMFYIVNDIPQWIMMCSSRSLKCLSWRWWSWILRCQLFLQPEVPEPNSLVLLLLVLEAASQHRTQ